MEKKTAPKRKKSGAPNALKATKTLKEKRRVTTKKTTTKKSWRKPKLTVLVRGKPEEMVLVAGCKRPNGGGSGLPIGITPCSQGSQCNILDGS